MFVKGANGAVGGYNLTRSLRFRASASAYLNRTMTTPTNNLKWTFRDMVKRGKLGTGQILFGIVSIDVSAQQYIQFDGNDKLRIFHYNSAVGIYAELITTQVFRDPSAFYDIQVAYDATQATASNRYKVYVNGAQVTSFSTATYPALNQAGYINAATQIGIGCYYPYLTNSFYDGYMAELYFIDGQALTPSSFGSTNSTTGVWQPAKYTGTYGTNGFYLPFTDNSALTTSSNVGLGKDFSGNGNYWTTNNISITAGVTYDSMTDVPTLTSATAANFAVLNPLNTNTPSYISNANLTYTNASSTQLNAAAGTIGSSSNKFYCEVTITAVGAGTYVGICKTNEALAISGHYYIGGTAGSYGYGSNGNKVNNVTQTAYGATYTTGDVIGIAMDLSAGTLVFYKNNVSQGTAFTGLSGEFTFGVSNLTSGVCNVNFGQRPFTYTPPTGFVALNAYNLPTGTILKGNTAMNIALDTGANIKTATEALFAGSQYLEWIKDRANANNHQLLDSVRGLTAVLQSNTASAETTYVAPSGNSVGWAWKAGTSSSSNTSGTITSTVSVNATAGFSVVTWNGTGANATVGHGLGVAPSFIIVKNRTAGSTSWFVYSGSIPATDYLQLNATAAQASSSTVWNNTAPTSSVFSIGTGASLNGSGNSLVAYCFASIAGYSGFGKYIGNGSADGTFVYTGFRPKWIMVFSTAGGDGWVMYDTSRDVYNVEQNFLAAQSSNIEGTLIAFDGLSNGFKIRTTSSALNTSGGSYVYFAFAENPFKNSLAR